MSTRVHWVNTMTRRSLYALGLTTAVGVGAAYAESPTVTPLAGQPSLLFGAYDTASVGYTNQEFVIAGEATSYSMPQPPSRDGRWNASPAVKAPYVTRIVVMRPADAKRFNGTVIVEWLNVSGGVDSPAVWLMAHRQIVRAGYGYVAVSAQKVGVEGGPSVMGPDSSLKKTQPQRYGSLRHPGDAFSYDVFSQAGRVVRNARPGGILGPLTAKHIIAVGESQSAVFMTTYVNAVDTLARVYDGFLIHSRFGGASQLDGVMAIDVAHGLAGIRLRPDLRVPVLTFITEGDLVGFHGVIGFYTARQPDTDRLRTWELAGASHADNYTIVVSPIDTGSVPVEKLAAAYAPTTSILGEKVPKPINFGPQQHYIVQTALDGLERWVRTGAAPPTSPRIELTDTNSVRLVLDEHGIAKGGIRTPWVDVPTARLSSDPNPGSLMVALFGTSEVFEPAQLKTLYPGGKADYLKRFEAALDRTIEQGFILRADRQEILDLAAAMYPAGSSR